MSFEQPDLFPGPNKAPISHKDSNDKLIIDTSPTKEPFLPGITFPEELIALDSFPALEAHGQACSACRLRSTCQQVVFGAGNVNSSLMIIGEGPGQDEDIQGVPFVGRAGQLLDKILLASDIERSSIYITNVVKCRPPGNRLPNPDEVKTCSRYLEMQIQLMKPEIIVCLGSMASQVVIAPKVKITQIRGQWLLRHGCRIIATFHPAALLRNPNYKRPTWEDFKSIRDTHKKIIRQGT